MGWPMMPVPINTILAMKKSSFYSIERGLPNTWGPNVGGGLLPIAVFHSTCVLTDTPLSGASPLPLFGFVWCLSDRVVGLEPTQTRFGGGQRLVFTANPTLITDAIQMLEQEPIVDLPSPRFVAPRVIRQLDMVDLTQVRGQGPGQITFHDLHVIDVVLQEQVSAAHLLANRQGLRGVVQVEPRDVAGVDCFHHQLDTHRLQLVGGVFEVGDKGFFHGGSVHALWPDACQAVDLGVAQ